jgi:MoaA/NifB/PqqE/SkfB family radical SAM enzyme
MATLPKKVKLLKGLLTGETAYVGPFYVTIDVTRRCNLTCLGCRYHSSLINLPAPGDQAILDISFDLVEKLCEELVTMGTTVISFMGEGEPMLHPRLPDFISMAKALGFKVTLITNGTLLDEARIHSLIDSHLDLLRVSLWASSIEEYEKNYPGTNPDYFKRIVNGLRLLSVLKAEKGSKFPSVHLHQPINKNNFQKIDALVDLAYETGCNASSFSPFLSHRGRLDRYGLSPEEEKSLCLSLTTMKKKLNSLSMGHNIDETLLRYRIGEAVWNKLPCYIGWLHARIKVDGTVLPCGPWNQPLGHLNENRFQEIWNGPHYRTFRQQTLTRQGLAYIAKVCDCGFCCLTKDNVRVHRFFQFFSPFLTRPKKGSFQGIEEKSETAGRSCG